MSTSKSEEKPLQPAHYWMTSNHCFWQRIGPIEMIPPKFFEIKYQQNTQKQTGKQ